MKYNIIKCNQVQTYRKSGESWNPLPDWSGLSGKRSNPSFTLLLGLVVVSACNPPFFSASIFFLTLPRRFSNLLVSMVIALWVIDNTVAKRASWQRPIISQNIYDLLTFYVISLVSHHDWSSTRNSSQYPRSAPA